MWEWNLRPWAPQFTVFTPRPPRQLILRKVVKLCNSLMWLHANLNKQKPKLLPHLFNQQMCLSLVFWLLWMTIFGSLSLLIRPHGRRAGWQDLGLNAGYAENHGLHRLPGRVHVTRQRCQAHQRSVVIVTILTADP